MWKNVEWARLQPGRVPMVCAKTGVPTTGLLRQTLIQRRRTFLFYVIPLPDSLQWLGALNPWLWLFGHRARISLPIAPGVRARYNAVRAAVAGCVVLMVAGVQAAPTDASKLAVFYGGLAGVVAARYAARKVWVSPRWSGVVRLRDPHPDFMAAVRGEANPLARFAGMPALVPATFVDPVPARPAPGWYADPTEQHFARWWDGAAWGQQVLAAPAVGAAAP
jgi:Protein of unknown function (DUF2510)